MNEVAQNAKTPFDFGRAIFLPFNHGPGSAAYTLKSIFFYALAMTVLYTLFGKIMLSALSEFIQISTNLDEAVTLDEISESSMNMLAMFGKILLPMIVLYIGIWVIYAMIETELHRRNLRHEYNDSFFPWRFGKDELRVMLSQLVVWFVSMGSFFVIYFIISIGGALAFVGGSENTALGLVAGLLAVVIFIAGIGVWIVLTIRLAPTAALSVAEDRFAIGDVWGVTQGRFWPSLGAYTLVAVAGYIILNVIEVVIMLALIAAFFMDFPTGFDKMDEREAINTVIELFSQPGFLASLTICLFVISLFTALWMLCYAGVGSHLVSLKLADEGIGDIETSH